MIFTFLDRYRDYGLLFLRLGFGFMYILHGWPKITGGTETWAQVGGAMSNFGLNFWPAFWGFLAACSEFGGGILIMTGFFFRVGCAAIFGTMFVAATMHYFNEDPFSTLSHPIENGIVLLSLIFIGPGRFSLDAMLRPSGTNRL